MTGNLFRIYKEFLQLNKITNHSILKMNQALEQTHQQ
jgi:hypothetical protein